jgi:tetratricopeptide (TPR) repeat protein
MTHKFFIHARPVLFFIMALLLIFGTQSCKPKKEAEKTELTDTADVGKAMVALNEKIISDPGNAALYHQRAQLQYQQRDFSKSLEDIKKAIAIDSTKAPYFLLLADLQFAANKTLMAKESLEKTLSLDPTSKDANMKLAEIYFYVRQYKKSIEYLDGVLKADVHNAKAYFMKGMNFKEMGDTTKAISSFQTTIEQNQSYYAAYMQLAIIMHARNSPMAIQYYDAAIRINPKSEEAIYGRGLYFQDHNELDKAIQDYTTLSQINPKNKQAYFNLGYLHYTYLKVYDQAIKHYNQAIAVDSSYVEAIYNRGLCYEALGDIGAAKRDFEKAIQLRPGYAAAINGMKRVQ